jgi:hypothetical protein
MCRPKYPVKKGKTPVLEGDDARKLIASIKVDKKRRDSGGAKSEKPDQVGLRARERAAVKRRSAIIAPGPQGSPIT